MPCQEKSQVSAFGWWGPLQAPTVLLGPMSPLRPVYSTLAGPHNARGVKLENVWKFVAFIS